MYEGGEIVRVIIWLGLIMLPSLALAGQVAKSYKWEENGKVHYSKTKPEGVSDYTVEFRESRSAIKARADEISAARSRPKPEFLIKILEENDEIYPGFWWWGVEGDRTCRRDYFKSREDALEVMSRTRERDNISSEFVHGREVTRISNGSKHKDILLSESKKACFLDVNGFKEYE